MAAREGIAKCCAARVVWNLPATGITPVALAGWHATGVSKALPLAPRLAVDTAIISAGLLAGVYPGQALFSQKADIAARSLEPEFAAKTTADGTPVTAFYYNKGM